MKNYWNSNAYKENGDYKFVRRVRHKYNDLLNKNKKSGYFIVEIVPKDQNNKDVIKPDTGDKADVSGAMVTDKSKA